MRFLWSVKTWTGKGDPWRYCSVATISGRSEELSIVNVVVPFCWGEQLGKVGTQVPFAIRVSLEKDGTRSILRGVGGNGKGCREVREVKDRFRQEQGFEGVEGGLTGRRPTPR